MIELFESIISFSLSLLYNVVKLVVILVTIPSL